MRWIRAGTGSLAAAGIAAAIYGMTLAPSVGAGDSAELILAAHTLGIPHPPGYPLWVLLARLAALVPIGEVAWRVNALSALLSALAVGLFHLLAARIGLQGPARAAATILFGASTIVWRSAVEAEIYPLATTLFLLLTLFALRARSLPGSSPRADALYFFAAGLAVVVHQTLLFPAAVYAIWILARDHRPSRVARSAAWSLLGLSVLFVLPLRMGAHPAFSWGDPGGFQAALDQLLRRNYGGLHQNPLRLDLAAAELWGMAAVLVTALGIPGAILAAAGSPSLRSRGQGRATPRAVPVALAALSIPAALVALIRFTPDPEHLAQVAPFLTPIVVSMALAAGAGVEAIRSRLPERARAPVAAVLLALVLFTAVGNFALCDRTGFRLAERYGRDLLGPLPVGATLVVDGDNETFLTAYATRMDRFRTDVRLIHRRGYIFGDPYGLSTLPRSRWAEAADRVDLERLTSGERPVHYATPPAGLAALGVRFQPAGLTHRAMAPARERSSRPAEVAPARAPVGWLPPADWPKSSELLPGGPGRFDYVTRKLAVSYSDAAARALWDQGRAAEALGWYVDAAAVGFDFVGARLNLATAAATVGKPELALTELLAARNLAPFHPEPAARLAVFLAAAGRHRDAALWFEKAYRIGPAPALASDAARAWMLAGDPERARQWRERAG